MTATRKIRINGLLAAALAVAAALAMLSGGMAQERTLEELKAEAQARAERNAYPLVGLKPEEVREALSRLKSLDRDEWAASWIYRRRPVHGQGARRGIVVAGTGRQGLPAGVVILLLRPLAGAELTRQAEGL